MLLKVMVGVDRKDWYVSFLFHFCKIFNFPLLFPYCLISKGYRPVSVRLVIPQKQWFSKAATSGCTLSQVLRTTQYWSVLRFSHSLLQFLSGGDCVCTSSNCFVFSCSFQSHLRLTTSVLCIPTFSGRKAAGLCWNFFTLFICTLKDVALYVTVILKVWILYDFICSLCWLYVFRGDNVQEIKNQMIATDI